LKQVLIAPDSFKGTFSAWQMARLIEQVIPNGEKYKIILQPLTDGGEGTLEILAEAYGATLCCEQVTGPYGKQVWAKYASAGSVALIEMAEASGLCHAKKMDLNPSFATTYGTGELIARAVERGHQKIILGLGGSATIDGGAGALQALGATLSDQQGGEISQGNQALGDLVTLSLEKPTCALKNVRLILATDVTNPLLGENGAVYVYGKQKGVSEEALPIFESRMKHFSDMIEQKQGQRLGKIVGAGSAGGLAFGLLAIGGEIFSGFQLVSERVGLAEKIKQSDLVITGEGKFDASSLLGKVTGSILALCQAYEKMCYVICGTANDTPYEMLRSNVKIAPLFHPSEVRSLDLARETPKRLSQILPLLLKSTVK